MQTHSDTKCSLGVILGALLCLQMLCLSARAGSLPFILVPAGSSDLEIQRALDGLPASGGEVVLAAGDYAIYHPLELSRNGLTLRGEGPTTVLRLADHAECPVVILGLIAANPGGMVHDLRLANLVVDGNRRQQLVEHWRDLRNNSGIQNNGIIIQSVSNSVVEHVTAAHCRSGGLVTAIDTRGLLVSDFTAFDNEFDGLACYRTEDCVFTRMNLHDNQAAGISLDLGFNHNVVADTSLSGNDLGIFMRSAMGNEFRDLRIQGSRHDGLFMAQSGTNTPNGWQLTPGTACVANRFIRLQVSDSGGGAFRVNNASCIGNVIESAIFSGNFNGGLMQSAAGLVQVLHLLD